MSKRLLIINTNAGLCNRLEEMLSFTRYGLDASFNKIYFFWENTSHCSGSIHDFIVQAPDIEILDASHNNADGRYSGFNERLRQHLIFNNKSSDFEEHKIIKVGRRGKHKNYTAIEPSLISYNRVLLEHVNEFISNDLSNNYIAIHLRAKDNNLKINHEEFERFINEYSEYNVFIATDLTRLQGKYAKKFPGRIVINQAVRERGAKRSDLYNAFFDLLVCSKASFYMGTPNYPGKSSYSNFIYSFRGLDINYPSTEYVVG